MRDGVKEGQEVGLVDNGLKRVKAATAPFDTPRCGKKTTSLVICFCFLALYPISGRTAQQAAECSTRHCHAGL